MEVLLINCEYDCSEERVKDAANILHDGPKHAKNGNIDFHSKEVKYHNVCKRDYLNQAHFSVTKKMKSEVRTSEGNVQGNDFWTVVFLYPVISY